MSVAEAARRLGVTRGRVNQLIEAGALGAERIGRAYAVRADDVERRAQDPPRPGRPSESGTQRHTDT